MKYEKLAEMIEKEMPKLKEAQITESDLLAIAATFAKDSTEAIHNYVRMKARLRDLITQDKAEH